MSLCKQGIYPAGEGAGYAGGIVSAAVDGIFVAEKNCRKIWLDEIKNTTFAFVNVVFVFRVESPAFDVNSLFRAYNHIRAVALIHDIAEGYNVALIQTADDFACGRFPYQTEMHEYRLRKASFPQYVHRKVR